MALIVLAGQYIAVDVSKAEDAHLGITEFEIACLPCHGVEGRGDGPLAHTLLVRPSDLTQISETNDGVFPEEKVTELIDGRSVVASHLFREMPVWGHRYRKSTDPGESDDSIDQSAHERIDALVQYLASIQEN